MRPTFYMAARDGIADLHIHTVASDGTCSIAERVKQAKNCDLTAIAITDHDSLSSNIEGRTTHINSLELITGVEVRADVKDTKVELLGYFVDPYDQQLDDMLTEIRDYRRDRNKRLIKRLHKTTSFDQSYNNIRTEADGILGRPHIANMLIEEGIVDSIGEAFDKYLASNGSAFVPMKRISASDVIDTIQNAGGVVSLAHPGRIRTENINGIVNNLIESGLDAIEVKYPYNRTMSGDYADVSVEDVAVIAEEHELIQTGGSDCHGPGSGKFRIGDVRVSGEQLNALRQRANQRRPL